MDMSFKEINLLPESVAVMEISCVERILQWRVSFFEMLLVDNDELFLWNDLPMNIS